VPTRAFTVALIGPDGAGKTTVARRIEETFSVPVKYLYMGVNAEASNRRLPTTRVVHAIRRARRRRVQTESANVEQHSVAGRSNPAREVLRQARLALALMNLLAEEWYRYGIAWIHVRRGEVVVFDRHFYVDYHASAIAADPKTIGRRIHGFILKHFYPKPDLLIYLDAPAEVLYERKREGTLEFLERRRRDYMSVVDAAPHAVVIDANRPLDVVVSDVTETMIGFPTMRSGGANGTR
jgi:thymidylate kinase